LGVVEFQPAGFANIKIQVVGGKGLGDDALLYLGFDLQLVAYWARHL
jgi:hypothetical protein